MGYSLTIKIPNRARRERVIHLLQKVLKPWSSICPEDFSGYRDGWEISSPKVAPTGELELAYGSWIAETDHLYSWMIMQKVADLLGRPLYYEGDKVKDNERQTFDTWRHKYNRTREVFKDCAGEAAWYEAEKTQFPKPKNMERVIARALQDLEIAWKEEFVH